MVRSTFLATYNQTPVAGVGRLAITKKLVLWLVLVLQVGFIGCIWLLQMSRGQESQQRSAMDQLGGRVNFVASGEAPMEKMALVGGTHCPHQQENVNRYDKDFYQMKPERLNESHLPDWTSSGLAI